MLRNWILSCGLAAILAGGTTALADHHLIDVNEVFTNADGSIQYVELIALANGQTNLAQTRVTARNHDGSVTNIVFDFKSSFNALGNKETILIATAGFEAVAGFAPDFVMPDDALIFYPDGRVEFRQDSGSIVDAVAYGNYSGSNTGFGNPAVALPCDGTLSLTRSGTGNDNETNWKAATNSPMRNDGKNTTLSLALNSDCNGNGVEDLCEINTGSAEDCNLNGVPDECDPDQDGDGIPDDCDEPGDLRGDSNCDGGVDFNDIDCFVAALIGEGGWRECVGEADCSFTGVNDVNEDGSVDFNDIDLFVECLIGGGCP